MGALMRSIDWSSTALGPVDAWPQSLRTSVSMLLPSKAQIALFWGADYSVLYNDAYRPVFGAKHPSALGRPGREAWSEIWDGVLHGLLADVTRTGEAYWARDRLFVLERNGFPEETYFDVSYDPVRVESGEVGGVYCIVTETTERVVSARRMALLRELAAEQRLSRSPREACAMAMQTIAAHPHDVTFARIYLDGEEQASTPDADAQLAATGAAYLREMDLPSPAGAAARGRLVLGVNPRRPFDSAYEGFLQLLASQLASAIDGARALEEETRRAETLAELDRAKTTFFSNVSHEFRTPLTLMLGPLADMLAAGDVTTAQRQRLEMVHRNAIRLQKLVNSLLDFSRIEAGRLQAQYVPADLSAITAELASAFRSAVEGAGLQFEVDCPPLPEPIYVDAAMWEKVVLNLLSNAFKYTLEGGIRVRVRWTGDGAELSVTDSGTGIPETELPHILERFHRVEGARGRSHEGTGIGLAFVQELVKLHGGTLQVTSAVDTGTTVTVHVPAGTSHLPADRVNTAPASTQGASAVPEFLGEVAQWRGTEPAASTPAGTDRARILVADDNADMRDYVARLLSERWDVIPAGDGHAALAAMREHQPDLVVSDVMMPGLDGFGLMAAAHAEPEIQQIPIILLSARAGEEAALEGIAAGAHDYLVKPFTARDLTARVEIQLLRVRERQEAERQRKRLYEFFMQAPMPISVFRGPNLVFEMANASYRDVIGGRDVLGKPVLEVMPELRGQGYDDFIRSVMASGEPHFGEEDRAMLARGPGGALEETYWKYVYAPLREPEGTIDRVMVIGYEVTPQVLARRELERAYTEVEKANRAKDDFLTTLSHELRTPLNAVIGWAHLLKSSAADADMRARGIAAIERSARAQAQLVEDLLDVSRIASGKLSIQREQLDFALAVASAVDSIRPQAAAKNITVELTLDPQPVVLDGDPARLRQVVTNLLANAIKFTPNGGRIIVQVTREDGSARLEVRDTGRGIDPAFLEKMFDRFAQADSSTTREHGGLGLGLSIVKHIVEAHGGTVAAESAGIGHGAAMIVMLPMAG